MPQIGSLLTDRDITDQLKLGEGADLQIKNWAPESITPVGYDVRAGETAFSLRTGKGTALLGKMTVAPGDTVFISSYESFRLSNKLAGFTLSRLSLLLDGLNLTALTVDPTWDDHLMIIVTNQGQKPIDVLKKEPLMTLCLFWVASPAEKALDKAKGHESVEEKFRQLQARVARGLWKKGILPLVVVGLGSALALLSHNKLMSPENAVALWVGATAFCVAMEERLR